MAPKQQAHTQRDMLNGSAHPNLTRDEHGEVDGFVVTCEIGRVRFDSTGQFTAQQQAFLLIAAHDAPGMFSFPAVDGTTCEVTVNYA